MLMGCRARRAGKSLQGDKYLSRGAHKAATPVRSDTRKREFALFIPTDSILSR